MIWGDDFGYTDAEQRAIDTAGRLTVMSLQKLRARDEARREPYVPWTVSAGQGPDLNPTTEGAT